MARLETYQYEPLDITEPHIRLLTLLPRDSDDNINLAIEHISIEEAWYEYDAVSYTWGPPEDTRLVKVNGKDVYIRQNIWHFLDHCYKPGFRDSSENGLWIDSICINQDDLVERSEQVRIMGEIFKNAMTVVIWLGAEISGSSALHEKATDFMQQTAPDEPAGFIDWSEFIKSRTTQTSTGTKVDSFLEQEISKILRADYWKRLWIIQEIALAFDASIVSGTGLIKIFDLRYHICNPTFREVVFHGQLIERVVDTDPNKKLTSLVAIVGRKLNNDDPASNSLAQLMSEFNDHLCQDPKDKVFGLLGLAHRADRIDVDYQHCAEEVFSQALSCFWQDVTDVETKDKEKWGPWYSKAHLKLADIRCLMTALKVSHRRLQAFASSAKAPGPISALYPFRFLTAIAYMPCTEGEAATSADKIIRFAVPSSFTAIEGFPSKLSQQRFRVVRVTDVDQRTSTPNVLLGSVGLEIHDSTDNDRQLFYRLAAPRTTKVLGCVQKIKQDDNDCSILAVIPLSTDVVERLEKGLNDPEAKWNAPGRELSGPSAPMWTALDVAQLYDLETWWEDGTNPSIK